MHISNVHTIIKSSGLQVSRLSLIQLYFTSKKMPCTLQRVKKHLLLNIVLYSSENKTQNCCPFFKNQKMKGNAAYCELSRDSHTVTLSSAGDLALRSVIGHSVMSNSSLRHGLQRASPILHLLLELAQTHVPLSLGLS